MFPRLFPTILLLLATAVASAAEPAEVLITRQLASDFEIGVGDVIELAPNHEAPPAKYRVVGVYEPVPDPMKLAQKRYEVRMHLPDLIDLKKDPGEPAKQERVTAINVALAADGDRPFNDANDARSGYSVFADSVQTRMPNLVVLPTTAGDDGTNPFAVLDRFHLAIAIVTVIGATAFLLALMVMRAEERRETVGVLRLIGLSRGRILAGVLVEGCMIAGAGALFGVVFALITQGLVNLFFQWHYETALVFVRVTPEIALKCVALSVPLGVLAGFVASWSLLRRDVVELLRR
ncbi:hypothetical protein ABI59_19800 [Acidobacteria bacterium Mor1]|nr:hypothetical protein ABI59_19800 [Acidobacteria bacterium Mor1]